MTRPWSLARRAAALAGLIAFATVPASAQELNLYTTREPGLIKPLMDAFTKSTGIKVNSVFIKDGLAERVAAEGAKSPADVLMTVDLGNLIDLVEKGLTQPVKSAVLEKAIPGNLRGANGDWFTLSLRARVLYAGKDLDLSTFNYESLADPRWKGKVCIRSGQHPYNTAMIAAYIAKHGEAKAEAWLRGMKANLGRAATGGDRDVARDIMGGICDIGIANSVLCGADAKRCRRSRTDQVGQRDQGDPADIRGRRHSGQYLWCVDREAFAEPRRRSQVSRVSRLRRSAKDLR